MKENGKTVRRVKPRAGWILLALCTALGIMILLSFTWGRYAITLGELLKTVWDTISGDADPRVAAVLWRIRLPRILLACLVGASLSTAGAAYQGVFQNPMAAPDLLGASNGAAFGAALAILMGGNHAVVTLLAFGFSLLTVVIVYLIGRRAKGRRTVNLVLSGMMISSLFSASTSYLKLVADPSNQLPAITYWLMGSLSGAQIREVGLAIIPMSIGLIPLLLLRWKINLLTLSEDEAHAIGVPADGLRLLVILCSTLVTAASVAVSGMIGWIGLVIPHVSRKMIGSDYRYLLPCSLISGALFLLITDNVSRNLLAVEIPIGILTAWIGAPFFLYLMLRNGGGGK